MHASISALADGESIEARDRDVAGETNSVLSLWKSSSLDLIQAGNHIQTGPIPKSKY